MTTKSSFEPKVSLEEAKSIITRSGRLFELETVIIDGKYVCRAWKNLWPNLRDFWIKLARLWEKNVYMMTEDGKTWTYGEIFEWSWRVALMFKEKFGVKKGDRVAIASLNCIEFAVCIWASHLLSAVPTLINAWIPGHQMDHCIALTKPKILILEPGIKHQLSRTSLNPFKSSMICINVLPNSHSKAEQDHSLETLLSKRPRTGTTDFQSIFQAIESTIPSLSHSAEPYEPAIILFTSGTTSLPKAVLSSQRGFLGNAFNVFYSMCRAYLRGGIEFNVDLPFPTCLEQYTGPTDEPPKVALLAVPLFHVIGCNSTLLCQTVLGAKIVIMRKWNRERGLSLILSEGVTSLIGVPSIALDVLDSDAVKDETIKGKIKIQSVALGGAPAPETLPAEFFSTLPTMTLNQGYGLTETNGVATSVSGSDYFVRPKTCGLPPPTCDILIVDQEKERIMPVKEVGEVWIRGSNIMKEYFNDPEATKKAITVDGWFKSGDLGYVDEEGFLYIVDRAKDIIIRGGENIHSVTVENALYAHRSILEAAAVAVPDRRLGELVAAVVTVRKDHDKLTEEDILEFVKKRLPHHIVPVMIIIQKIQLERNAAAKILKDPLRRTAREEWAKRTKLNNGKAKL